MLFPQRYTERNNFPNHKITSNLILSCTLITEKSTMDVWFTVHKRVTPVLGIHLIRVSRLITPPDSSIWTLIKHALTTTLYYQGSQSQHSYFTHCLQGQCRRRGNSDSDSHTGPTPAREQKRRESHLQTISNDDNSHPWVICFGKERKKSSLNICSRLEFFAEMFWCIMTVSGGAKDRITDSKSGRVLKPPCGVSLRVLGSRPFSVFGQSVPHLSYPLRFYSHIADVINMAVQDISMPVERGRGGVEWHNFAPLQWNELGLCVITFWLKSFVSQSEKGHSYSQLAESTFAWYCIIPKRYWVDKIFDFAISQNAQIIYSLRKCVKVD